MAKASVSNASAARKPMPPHVALYMRVSTEDQADRGTIDAQRDFLRQFAQLYQLPVANEYADDGVTGTLPLGQRPEGQRLLQDAEAGRFGCVLVYRLTRLGRSLKALTEAHDVLAQYGVTIRSATEPFDTSTPIGTFLFQLLGSLAELDRAQVLEQLTRGRDRVARNGKWTEGPVPYGYALDESGCLTPSPRLVPIVDMTEAQVVQDIFLRMANGSSAIGEARRLNALGVPTTRYQGIKGKARPAGKRWYPVRMAQIIASSTYRGIHVYQSKYGTIEREVPALVHATLWEQTNAQLQRNRKLPKRPRAREYLLRGLITCGACGAAYVGQVVARPSGKRNVYYRCGNRGSSIHPERGARCKSKIVDAAWLEEEVWSDIREFARDPKGILEEAHRELQARQGQVKQMTQDRDRYVRALGEKATERERIMVLFRRGRIALQDAETQLDDIAREEVELRQQMSAFDAQQALLDAYQTHVQSVSSMLTMLQGNIAETDKKNDMAKKRDVIEKLVFWIRIHTHTGESPGDKGYHVEIKYKLDDKERIVDNCGRQTVTL
jgi:site-specific DNA recombinase